LFWLLGDKQARRLDKFNAPLKGGSISNVDSILWDTIEIPRPYWFLLYQVAPLIKLSKNIQEKQKGRGIFFDIFQIVSFSFVMNWCWWRGH
jgi:hypothetical protein